MSDITMPVRRALNVLEIGKSTTLTFPGADAASIETEARKFAKARSIKIETIHTAAGVVVTRIEKEDRVPLYPEIDALEVGGSILFDWPPAMHQRIRLAASQRSQSAKVRLSCTREGDGMRVTRLPITEAEAAACGPLAVATRVLKYDLERLAAVRELRFEVPRPEEAKLRLAAHRQGVKTGWPIRCRRQDDGSMLVYRTDMPAQAAAGDSDRPEPSTSAASPR